MLGFDIGDRWIGASISDTTWLIASPLVLIDLQKNWKKELTQIFSNFPEFHSPSPNQTQAKKTAIAGIICGLPLLLNGDTGPQAQKVKTFIETNLFPLEIPILLWDERLSTHGANRALMEGDMSRQKRKLHIDKQAAVFILQGVLDRLNYI